MPARTTQMTGTEIQEYLASQAQRRADLIRQADEIEQEVFVPMNLSSEQFLTGSRKSRTVNGRSKAPRAKKGEQKELIMNLLSKSGTITSKEITKAFKAKGYRTNAHVVLGRLTKDRIIKNEARGVYTAVKAKA